MGYCSASLLARIREIFYIALGNFVFPIVLNVAQIALILIDPSFEDGTCIVLVNDYVTIIGVVFATVWTSGQSWKDSDDRNTGSTWNQGYAESGGSRDASRISRPQFIRLPNTTFRTPREKSISEAEESSLEMGKKNVGGDGVKSTDSSLSQSDY